jgi:3-phosphoshikimate 1-carboxyvinyltransferase
MDSLHLDPSLVARGTVALPGSKSISNRTLILAALAEGTTLVKGLLKSDDTDVMLAALATLGVSIERVASDVVRVVGCGGNFPVRETALFLGNAGTAFRPLTAVLALQSGMRRYLLDGVPRMRERPIGDLVDGLAGLGTQIRYLGKAGYPPLQVLDCGVQTADVLRVRGDVSSQFLTALLLSLPLTKRAQSVEVIGELISKPYVEITLNLMARFGVAVTRDGWSRFAVAADAQYRALPEVQVEGDASSASYFLAAGAIAGGPVRVTGVGRDSIQGDVRFADALAKMGATVTMGQDWIEARAPAKGALQAVDMDFNHIPDAAMTIAVLALFAEGTTVLRNIASWRVKETDRISAMATELRKLGATVEEGADYLRVTPFHPTRLIPNPQIHTYDDHRMAMCFSLASLGQHGVPVIILDPQCVAKTFPTYFDALGTVTVPAT